jgi:signal transduction histidine kinase
MRLAGPKPYLPLAIGAGLFVALVSLAFLQFRWIARLSEAERDRLRDDLQSASARLADDVDRELARASREFQPEDGLGEADLEGDLAARLARWRSSAPEPKLVGELLVVRRLERGELDLQRFDERTGRLASAAWDASLDSLRRIFEARGRVPFADEVLPGLILRVRAPRPPPGREPPEPGERRPPRDHVVVRFDRSWLTNEYLPRLAAQEFAGKQGLDYEVTVVVAAAPDTVVFRSGPRVASGSGQADVSSRLFALRNVPERNDSQPPDRPPRRPPRGPAEAERREPPPAPGADPGRWLLEVRHPSGSLEAAVSSARRRNLVISLAVLALLGTTSVLLVISTRRAQRLARQQMDFVASVSHELRTPLTAMRSAGQNLADGIVDDPEKIRKYGALIEREGRRLTEMVGRVLAFAGVRSGSQVFRMQPTGVRPLVDAVLADARWALEEKHVQVEADVADGLPAVRGDEAALRQALANLVDNALKYGGTGAWLGIRAGLRLGPRGEEVALSVSDRGTGIKRSDLPHVFDPFFRSDEASSAGIAGSGLGLAVVRGIVEAHGGRVTAESTHGKGSTFTIHLPVSSFSGEKVAAT